MSERCPICKQLFNSTHDFYPMACDRCDLPAEITRLRALVREAYEEGYASGMKPQQHRIPWAESESKRKSEGE